MMTDEKAKNESLAADEVKVRLLEEVADVSTRERVTGRVRVSTVVETVEEMVRAALHSEAVEVTRVTIDRPVDAPPPIRTEGDVTIVPVLEEVLVVEKRLMLKEELHIRRMRTTETVEQPVQLRRQQAVVERLDAQGQPDPKPAP